MGSGEDSETNQKQKRFILKKYEAVFILDIRKTDDEGAAFTKEFAELIANLGGKLESDDSDGAPPVHLRDQQAQGWSLL